MKKTLRVQILALVCALFAPAGASAWQDDGGNGLSFALTDGRALITREMGAGLLLRAVKDSSVSQRDFGWRIEVVRKPYRSTSPNLLYHSRRTLGAHPSQVYAWHVTAKQFPNVRELDVAGRPLVVRIELIDPVAEGEGTDSRFLSGEVRITWGPKRAVRGSPRAEGESRRLLPRGRPAVEYRLRRG